MKHTWVTSLSVFGIIGAGSAAVLANTTVFNGVAKTSAAITIDAQPSTTTTTVTVAPTDATVAPTTALVEPVAQPYAVGSSGTVDLVVADGIITISGTMPATGWSVQRASAPATWVSVEFMSPNQRVVFNAFLIDGQVQVSVDSAAPDQPAAVTANGVPSQPTQRATIASAAVSPTTSKPVVAKSKPAPETTVAPKTTHTTAPVTTDHGHDDD